MSTTTRRTPVSTARKAVMQADATYWQYENAVEDAFSSGDLDEVQRILIDAMEDAWTLGHGTPREGESR